METEVVVYSDDGIFVLSQWIYLRGRAWGSLCESILILIYLTSPEVYPA